jgi:tRNA dimethylallyltransferase
MKKYAVAIFGPTGVGKSAIAIELAGGNKGEIISVDSMQVYKYMDIGTAKPPVEHLEKVKHHLIDIITPDIQFNAGDFKRLSEKILSEILEKGRIPFFVGGTGLYFSSLIRGLVEIPELDDKIKTDLIEKWKKIGQERMYRILSRVDREYAEKIHPNDMQRTLRALEVFLGTGQKYSDFRKKSNFKDDTDYILVGITMDRPELYRIINERVEKMIGNGLVDEVRRLVAKGYNENDPGMKAIGYNEILSYVNGKCSLETAVSEIKKNSRRYAKRQMTWFKKISNVSWFSNRDIGPVMAYIKKRLGELSL